MCTHSDIHSMSLNIPGGKSFFSKYYLTPKGYVHVNRVRKNTPFCHESWKIY